MKILIVSSLYPPYMVGGAEKVAAELAAQCVIQGHSVVVVTLSPQGQATKTVEGGQTVYRIPLSNLYWPFKVSHVPAGRRLLWHLRDLHNGTMAREFKKILDVEAPDVVNTHNVVGFSTALWHVVHEAGIRLVHTLHDYYLTCPKTTRFCRDRNCGQTCASCRVFEFKRRNDSQSVNVVIGVSQYVLDVHLAHGLFSWAKAVVIHNAALPSGFSVRRIDVSEGSGKRTVGYLGRVAFEKGIEVFIDAATTLSSERYRWLVAGLPSSPEYLEELKARVGDIDIRFLGYLNSAEFLSSIDVLVVPSLWNEPYPTSVIEALAVGVPVVGSRLGGITEQISDGINGVLFAPGNSSGLAEALERIERVNRWGGNETPDCLNVPNLLTIEQQTQLYLEMFTE